MREIWRDVPNYEGLYQVSNFGQVRNVKTGKSLRPRTSSNGYQTVALYKHTLPATISVHRLVAIAFIPNPDHKLTVNHKNGVKSDNHVTNLEWATRSENQRHRYDVLGKRQTTGLPVVCVETGAEYQTATEAAKALHLCRSAITNCCRGKRNHTGGLHFRYKEEQNHVN